MQTISDCGDYDGKTHSQILAEKKSVGKCPPTTRKVYWTAQYAHIRATGFWLDGTLASAQEKASAKRNLDEM